MENNIHQIRRPSIEELSKRFQDLQDAHDHLKQQRLEFMISSDPETSNSISSRRGTQHSASALNLTEAEYVNILQSIDEPIHIINTKGCIIYRNQAWENFYGYTAADIRGRRSFELIIDPGDELLYNDIQQHMLKGGYCWTGEFPVRNKRGERFIVIDSTKPIHDENGTVIGIITVSAAPTRVASDNPQPDQNNHTLSGSFTSMVNETRSRTDGILSSKYELEGNEQGGCFDSTTGRLCWHWLPSDQPHKYGMSAEVENPPQVVNSNCAGHGNKALGPWSQCNYSDCEIKWEDLMVKEQIGQGSCGTVYHAKWQGSDVALKLFSKQEHSHDSIVSFMQEISIMKRIRHPNIMLFMGAVTSPQRICIVTEFLCRGNLFELLRQYRGRLKWSRRIHMAIDIARGMNYLHHCLPPIIHRDLNSSNLLVDKDWTVKVGGFCLSRTKHETYVTTKEGIRTPEWTAPEVLRNEEADERSDVYSYGVVLWEITTEKIPWNDLNSMQATEAIGFMNQGLDIPKDVDPRWASLIQRCLCSEPQSRPTFQEILDELIQLHICSSSSRRHCTKRQQRK